MIRADIAIAALSEQVEQRVRIAALLLAAYRIRAKVRIWDGTRCTLLITDLSDTYGRQAFELAKKRGAPALVFNATTEDQGPRIALVADGSPAPVMAHAIRELLGADTAETSENVIGGPQPALCRLADSEFCGRPVDATFNSRTVRIRPEEGRVYSPSFSDLLSARDTFSSADWTLSVVATDDAGHHNDSANRSLEAFLLQSAFHGREQLPEFPEGRYRLKDWPDVGSAPELVGALKIANALLRRPMSANDLRMSCGVTAHDVNASLWAYRAANLLAATGDSVVEAAPAPPPTGTFSGILARIATRFGLGKD